MYQNPLIQSIIRIFYPYNTIRTVLKGPIKGMKFKVAPGMGLTYALGFDSLSFSFLQTKIQTGTRIFDIGANRGQMALFFSKMVGSEGKVYCFEPMINLQQRFKENIKLNNLENVTLFPVAASSESGETEFLYNENASTQGKIEGVEGSYKVDNTNKIVVKTSKLDDILMDEAEFPNLLKIDVEGAAALVFEGATNLLDRKPDIYIVQKSSKP